MLFSFIDIHFKIVMKNLLTTLRLRFDWNFFSNFFLTKLISFLVLLFWQGRFSTISFYSLSRRNSTFNSFIFLNLVNGNFKILLKITFQVFPFSSSLLSIVSFFLLINFDKMCSKTLPRSLYFFLKNLLILQRIFLRSLRIFCS